MTASVPPDPRQFYCLALRDIPGILAHDWKFAWFRVAGLLYKQPTGFAQGSPASSGAANLFAAVCGAVVTAKTRGPSTPYLPAFVRGSLDG